MKYKSQIQFRKLLSRNFISLSVIPILVIEITFIISCFSINSYITSKNTDTLLKDAISYVKAVLSNEVLFINEKFSQVTEYAKILQNEHQNIFKNLTKNKPIFQVANNGVFYKVNKIGSSLYYSSQTTITNKELNKAIFTESMDISLKSIVDNNIKASYFNSWDNMNRLYPYIDNVYKQYGSYMTMTDYSFYYLANKEHNSKGLDLIIENKEKLFLFTVMRL